jgi:ankyrin repeat protein
MVAAASRGNVEEVGQLLDRGASPDAYGVDYVETALIAAVRSESEEIVALLLSNGANPDLTDFEGVTALEHAANVDNQAIVYQLRTAVETNDRNESTKPPSDNAPR